MKNAHRPKGPLKSKGYIPPKVKSAVNKKNKNINMKKDLLLKLEIYKTIYEAIVLENVGWTILKNEIEKIENYLELLNNMEE